MAIRSKFVYIALSLGFAVVVGAAIGRFFRTGQPRHAYPPRTQEVVRRYAWEELEIQLPAGWEASADGRVTWTSVEDAACTGTLLRVVEKLPTQEEEVIPAIAKLLRRKPEEIQSRQGQFGARIYWTERVSAEGGGQVSGRSLVIFDDRVYLHHSKGPYRTPLEKQRAAEQWMILDWIRPRSGSLPELGKRSA